MDALKFINIIKPFHQYLDLAQGKEGDILHPTITNADGTVEVLNTWFVYDEGIDSQTDTVEGCQRCNYLAIAGYKPVRRPETSAIG